MTTQEFNRKYNLQTINPKWFKIQTDKKEKEIQITGKPSKVWKDIARRFFTNKWNIIFGTITLIIILLSIIVPLTSHYSETKSITAATPSKIGLLHPSWLGVQKEVRYLSPAEWNVGHPSNIKEKEIIEYVWLKQAMLWKVTLINKAATGHQLILGTDSIGRDVWTRLWIGTGWSLKLSITVAIIETLIGVSVGIYVGYHVGKALDTIVMRIIEIFTSVPPLLWLILLTTIMGANFGTMVLALTIVGWAGPVWAARMFTIKVKDQDFILAAESVGVSKVGRIFKHILPNILGKLLVSFVLRIPAVIFFEATLIFLGLSVGGADAATLGSLINGGRAVIFEQPFFILGPTLVILLLTISLQIMANGLRDAFDPKIIK